MTEVVVIFVLLVLSGFFSGSETAMTALPRVRADSLRKDQRLGADALWRLKEQPDRMLITILIGNNVVNLSAATLATVVATRWFGQAGPGIAVGVLTLLTLVIGEVTPKSLAIRYSEPMSLVSAPVIYALSRAMAPLVWAMEHFTRWVQRGGKELPMHVVTAQELLALAGHSAASGSIAHGEHQMIQRILAFTDLKAEDVMTPRHQVFALESSHTVREALPLVLGQTHSRIPIYTKNRDDLRQVLHLRDLLAAVAQGREDAHLEDLAREPLFVPAHEGIDRLFTTFRTRNLHLAIVVDEYGSVDGLVTLEDLLEELVGEIYDETDRPKAVLRELAPGEIRVDGAAETRLVREYFRLEDMSARPTDTVSLWLLNDLERIPAEGEELVLDGLHVVVESAGHKRIRYVRLRRAEAGEGLPSRQEADSATRQNSGDPA